MGRTPCCDKNGLKKGPWTPEEDQKLTEYISTHGPGNWRNLPKNAGLQRCGKSCRLRWTNYLRPDIKRGRFSFEEEETIIQLHSVLGNKWSAIAARLPGRTDNEIKNYWNTHIRKRLLKMGIDPVTHSPRLDLLDISSLLNSAQLNLANLISLQTLINPEALRLLTTLLASNNVNETSPESLLNQKLQDNNHILSTMNAQMQNQPPFFQPHHQMIQNMPQGQHVPMQNNNAPSASYPNNNIAMHETLEQFLMNSSSTDHNIESGSDLSDNSVFQSLKNISNNNNSQQHFDFDSVFSTTPISSPGNLNQSSVFMNNISAEEEKESYCCNLMKFEIPESLDFQSLL
ncbi:hypothetical protein Leryth_027085 [Lithospermum erythrorhizon]|nr:hypothetical protein Leryth_027085 [Lithospermum erythrorhizon]